MVKSVWQKKGATLIQNYKFCALTLQRWKFNTGVHYLAEVTPPNLTPGGIILYTRYPIVARARLALTNACGDF